jgi:hypothetical protein
MHGGEIMKGRWHQVDWDLLEYGCRKPNDDRSISKMICWALDCLSSTMPGKWVGAIDWLGWNFLAVGEPQPVFVPFLLELLQKPQTRCRGRILDWLGCLCMAHEVFAREEVKSTRNLLAETRAVLWSGLDTFLDLLDDERTSVRTSAVFPAALLIDGCREHLPPSLSSVGVETQVAAAFERRLALEHHPVAKSSLIIGTGYVARTQSVLIAHLRSLFLTEGDASVRMATAMALAVCDPDIPDEALQLLVREVRENPADCEMHKYFSVTDSSLEARHNPLVKAYANLGLAIGPAAADSDDAGAFEGVFFPWTNANWPVISAVRALCLVRPPKSQASLSAITRAVSFCHDHESLDVLQPILPAVFQGRKLGPETRRADLSQAEYSVLRAIYDNPLLWPGGNTFSAYRTVGLSMHRRDWRLMLEIDGSLDPVWYFERLVRRENRLDDDEPLTERHYQRVKNVVLYHMVDNRYVPLLARFPLLEWLHIHRETYGVEDGFAIDREGIAQLPVLLKLTHLQIRQVNVQDIPQIERFRELGSLDLGGTEIDDAFVRRLPALPKIWHLYFWNTKLTDACLGPVTQMPALTSLNLDCTLISDAAVGQLTTLTNLHTLGVSFTRITKSGYRRLKEALPNCRVEWSPQ